jgi:RNA polymerase sigma factor (sigma-70 family)
VGSSIADTRSLSDADALARVRHGDAGAYGILYQRHVERARRLACSIVNNRSDADDVVAEAFASVLSALEGGKGPIDSFVPYLMSSVRNESYRANRRLARRRTVLAGGEHDEYEYTAPRDPFKSVDEATIVRAAFTSLAPRLREVLWQTEVEELSHRDIAKRTGSSPRAVAMLALRARQALGGAYLHAHLELRNGQISPACREIRPQLAALVRNRVTPRHRARLQQHLASCPACREAHEALGRLNGHLRVLALLPVGEFGASGLSGVLGVRARLFAWFSGSGAHLAVASSLVIGCAVIMPVAVTPTAATAVASPASAFTSATTEPRPTAPPFVPDHVPSKPNRRRVPPAQQDTALGSGQPSTKSASIKAASATGGPSVPTTPEPARAASSANAAPPTTRALTTPSPPIPPLTVSPVTVPPVTVPPVTVPPVTVPPVTVPPVTVPPVTVPPVTVPPVTVPPVTVPPVTVPPVTVAPPHP